MPPLRIGLLGCGQIARAVHLPVLRGLPNVRVAALAESNEGALAAAAVVVPDAARFPDFQSLIGSGQIDAAVVCLPPHLHAASSIAAFEAGLHVYLEKPLAPSASEGARVIDAWRRAGTVGMIGFNFRFHPQVERIRQRVRAGEIGTVLGMRSVFSILPHQIPEWKRTRALGGGVLLDLASHHVDIVHHLLGDAVVRAYASVRSLDAEGDHAALQLDLASGASVQTFVSLGTVDEHRVELLGTAGKLVMDRTELTRPEHVAATLRGARVKRVRRALEALEPARLLRSPGAEPSFAAALGAFAVAAAGGAFDGPDLVDGARCLAVIEAAERAASTGVAVKPEWDEPASHGAGTSTVAG